MDSLDSIKVLPPELQNQIAAGEVVERPASVVKELVENSLDAGATQIRVDLDQGGRTLIRVEDNGCGISARDLPLALTRHATSKISKLSDLNTIISFGFRGEALPSIASVSEFSIVSRPQHQEHAAKITLSFGREIKQSPAALDRGTIIEVRDIFAQLPARLKFLKAITTENRRCSDLFLKLALANSKAGLELYSSQRPVHIFHASQSLKERLSIVWPPAVLEGLLELEHHSDDISLSGFIGSPQTAQARSGRIFFYVNNRPVQDKLLLQALRKAYQGVLVSREYPQCVIFITISPDLIDVNAHPAKTEVRFRDERQLFSVVMHAVQKTLAASQIPVTQTGQWDDPQPQMPVGIEAAEAHSHLADHDYGHIEKRPKFSFAREDMQMFPANEKLLPGSNPDTLPIQNKTEFIQDTGNQSVEPDFNSSQNGWNILGTVDNTYILAQRQNGSILIIDQHAAHERILFNSFSNPDTPKNSQLLLLPRELELHPAEKNAVTTAWPQLINLGFVLEFSPSGMLTVKGVPERFTESQAVTFLKEIAREKIIETDHIWIKMACHLAIRAGDSLSNSEIMSLLSSWETARDKMYCPHGRPTTIELSPGLLEKMFKRK